MLWLLIPPVGRNFIPGKGAESDFKAVSPPYTFAGKNFTTESPNFTADMISDGATQPGVTVIPALMQYFMISSSKPGETIKPAPADTAALHCSRFMTVPAPTSISGQADATAAMLSFAAAVRKVISITSIPPARSAFAVGTASSALSSTTTGTIQARENRSSGFIRYLLNIE